MYFIESFLGGNSQLRVYHHSLEHIRSYLNNIKRLRDQFILDYEKMNEEFGEPCQKDWDEYNETVPDMTPENVHEYEARTNAIREKTLRLWKIFVDSWIEKNNPEWAKFFKDNSDFGDISSELEFHIFEIKEFPNNSDDFLFDEVSEVRIEVIRMGRH